MTVGFGLEMLKISGPERVRKHSPALTKPSYTEQGMAKPKPKQARSAQATPRSLFKICTKCGEMKPATSFHRHKGTADGRQTQCAACVSEAARKRWNTPEWQMKQKAATAKWARENKPKKRELAKRFFYRNQEKENERSRKYYQTRPDYHREHRLKSIYGITIAQFEERQRQQGGGCAICGTTNYAHKHFRNLLVDHCHDCNKIRGLLCNDCNLMIGHAGDSIERLEKGIAYLKEQLCNHAE